MFVRLGSRFRSLRTAIAAGVTIVLLLSLAGSIELPRTDRAGPGQVAPERPKIGELPERRTEASTTRRNQDGTLTTTVFNTPVHYRAGDGSWQPIDSTLHATGETGYAWRSGANAYQMRFRPVAGADFAEFRIGGRTFRLHAEGTRDGGRSRVDGGQITYPGAYPGADLRYQVGATGVQKVIDLAGPDSPTTYTFRMSAVDGGAPMSVQARSDGSYAVLAAPLHGPAFVLAAPVVQEAAGEHEVAAPAVEARPTMRVTARGSDLVVTLGIDEGWLRAPGRRFPVHLDPTMVIQPDVEDASFVTLNNYLPSVGDRLFIGSGTTNTWRAALQFDLGGVPSDAQLTDATLGL